MTEAEFRQLLLRIDAYFRPRRIGSSNGAWVTVGALSGDARIEDIQEALKAESARIDIRESGGEIYIRVEEDLPRKAKSLVEGRDLHHPTEPDQDQVILRLPKIPRINLILFLLTVFTTLLAGAFNAGGSPLTRPLDILMGVPFSLTLMLILGTHEFGHYFYARKNHVDATLPYFLPAPPFIFMIGTFGAFIKIRSPIYRREALLQIGAAGPIAGFLVAVPALIVGLYLSDVVELAAMDNAIYLGNSLLMKLLTALIQPGLAENQDIMLHPVAFAGWIGLLVTMLNLLPIGQLDGGHVAYALLGDKHNLVAKMALFALIPLSFFSLNWLVWGALIIILMRTTRHPPVQDIYRPLSDNNKLVGYVCLLIFILCFIPAPFKL